MACVTALSVGLLVGILAVGILVFTAVVVRRRRRVTMKWKNVGSTDEIRMDEHKLPLCNGIDGVESNITT